MLTPKQALDLEFDSHELHDTVTIREYLKAQLRRLWSELDGFSGKRPLGDSGWDWAFAPALAHAGVIKVVWEDPADEELISSIEDEDSYYEFIYEMIAEL